jgi:hypothetical protein
MKKATIKVLSAAALVGGLVLGAVCNGLLAFLGALALAYAGALGLLGKEEILYY